jgi:predicted phage baseplate assembly protein
MPITVPPVDDRRYADLVAESVARIAVHNPEWTNYNRSDPGITLLELFAFLTENLLYRANQIPERNRLAFLSLLGVPLQPAASAQGLVTFANERGPLRTVTLSHDLEVTSGQVPFYTVAGLDVLPVQALVLYKRQVSLTDEMTALYQQLYASFVVGGTPGQPPADLSPYETVALDGSDPAGVDLTAGTVDGALWVALLTRRPEEDPDTARGQIAGQTLSLGVVPVVADPVVTLPPASSGTAVSSTLEFAFPVTPPNGTLPTDPAQRVAQYAVQPARQDADVLQVPGVVQVPLPASAAGLGTWTNLEPLEDGADAFPPPIADPAVAARLITWLRIRAPGGQARILWAGINAAVVTQREHVAGEILPDGTGQPDQAVQLARTPVIPGSVTLTVSVPSASTPPGPPVVQQWAPIDDLLAAGPEVPVSDPSLPPGTPPPPPGPTNVYVLDPEAGVLRFGDGLRGSRPPAGASLVADYDYGVGQAGNVGPATINSGPALPAGFTVTNPVRTWGGADSETVADGEKQVARYLQHRDRLVTAADFDTITRRTPGAQIARVDVLAAYDPQLAPNLPGSAPGSVTLLIVPTSDPANPDTPAPDRFLLDAICAYLDPRRLVTTELHLCGPSYVPIWVSVGIDVAPGANIAETQQQVRAELARVLSPLPLSYQADPGAGLPTYPHAGTGWPLATAVSAAELAAYATRVSGVRVVNGLLIAAGSDAPTASVPMTGLQLPRVAGLSVSSGDPVPVDQLRGAAPAAGPVRIIPVPVVPEGC